MGRRAKPRLGQARNRKRRERLERRRRYEALRRLRGLKIDVDLRVPVLTRARRNEVPNDDVLLETEEIVLGPADRRIGKHARRLLERRRRNERLRRQARLRDSEQQRLGRTRLEPLLLGAVVDVAERALVHVLRLEEFRLPRIHDAHLLKHLPDDHANVLVVDLHALQAIHLLHLVEQILLHGTWPLDPQNVVRIHRAFRQTVTSPHAIALVHTKVLTRRNLVQLRLLRLVRDGITVRPVARRLHEDLALAALDLTESHRAVDLRNRRRILRPARLEQLGHPRKTTGDVARLVCLTTDLRENGSRADLLTVIHRQLRADPNHEVAQMLLLPALLLHDLDVRVEALLAILDDHALTQTGELVELLGHRLVLDDVDETNRSFDVGDDRVRVWVPGEDHRVLLYLLAVGDGEQCAERHREA